MKTTSPKPRASTDHDVELPTRRGKTGTPGVEPATGEVSGQKKKEYKQPFRINVVGVWHSLAVLLVCSMGHEGGTFALSSPHSLDNEINDPYITMEEYVRCETEKALRNGQMYNWETAKYGKINYIRDINYLRFFETKFPPIVYDDALSSQHVDEVNWENETSLSEYDDGKYNAISKRKSLKK
ncbi:hypothetical protein Tco_0572435 [Tanacetum coccineum]